MRISLSEVKVGMLVWSRTLEEYITVQKIVTNDRGSLELHDGIFCLTGSPAR